MRAGVVERANIFAIEKQRFKTDVVLHRLGIA
jgi:hypothetical protein